MLVELFIVAVVSEPRIPVAALDLCFLLLAALFLPSKDPVGNYLPYQDGEWDTCLWLTLMSESEGWGCTVMGVSSSLFGNDLSAGTDDCGLRWNPCGWEVAAPRRMGWVTGSLVGQ